MNLVRVVLLMLQLKPFSASTSGEFLESVLFLSELSKSVGPPACRAFLLLRRPMNPSQDRIMFLLNSLNLIHELTVIPSPQRNPDTNGIDLTCIRMFIVFLSSWSTLSHETKALGKGFQTRTRRGSYVQRSLKAALLSALILFALFPTKLRTRERS